MEVQLGISKIGNELPLQLLAIVFITIYNNNWLVSAYV